MGKRTLRINAKMVKRKAKDKGSDIFLMNSFQLVLFQLKKGTSPNSKATIMVKGICVRR